VLVLPGVEDVLPVVAAAVWGEAVRQLLRAGYEHIAGYLDTGIRGWAMEGLPVHGLPQLTTADTWSRMQRGERRLLDVRQPKEWAAGHAPGAAFIPGAALPARTGELDVTQSWAVTCSTGYRSTVAASVLLRAGIKDVANVMGGMTAWKVAELREEQP